MSARPWETNGARQKAPIGLPPNAAKRSFRIVAMPGSDSLATPAKVIGLAPCLPTSAMKSQACRKLTVRMPP